MNIMLGNLKVKEIESRAGVVFSDDLKLLLSKTHQSSASNVAEGKWHCFDIPFTMVCGDMAIAKEIYSHLKSDSENFKEPLRIALA